MDYSDFKLSLSQNSLHMVSGALKNPSFVQEFDEPAYLLQTSGSQGQKAYIHTLSSIKASTASFFEQFAVSKTDCWGLCLSTKHVAGFSILARSYFGNLKEPCVFEWSVKTFKKELEKNSVTIVSLVPTQVFDLVINKVQAPEGFKFLFVGGGAISPKLIDDAIDLGWPVVVCYGSTETFAQMSFSSDGEFYKPYKGWQVRLSQSNEIEVKGEGLYDYKVLENKALEKRTAEWFSTGDVGELDGKWFSPKGKLEGLVKIKGSYFDFNLFKKTFSETLSSKGLSLKKTFPVVVEEKRNGAGVYLVTTEKITLLHEVLERTTEVRGVFKITEDVFSEIGKVKKTKLEGVLLKPILCL